MWKNLSSIFLMTIPFASTNNQLSIQVRGSMCTTNRDLINDNSSRIDKQNYCWRSNCPWYKESFQNPRESLRELYIHSHIDPIYTVSEKIIRQSNKMKSKNYAEKKLDSMEANERCDRLPPMTRSPSKSPHSDEGIEPDSERKQRCGPRRWSLDSSLHNDDDTVGVPHVRRKSMITRCCSSDSAVVSDEDQARGKGYIFSLHRY